jgi:SAM-dependent methyltransferase
MQIEPTKRFSNRVANYVKYRPGYPAEVISFLTKECGLSAAAVIADIGSGTGIFTSLLLNQGFKVYAVEPNNAMQEAAVEQLGANENFIPVIGGAEATALPDKSVDLIVCAQAYHWFSNDKTRLEFRRILKDEGYVGLIWNNRQANEDDFSKAYEELLKRETKEYTEVNHRNISENDLRALFRNGVYKTVHYPNVQVFDEDGLMGRAFSASYVPPEGTAAGEKFRGLLKGIFNEFNTGGEVSFHYQTEVYLGKVWRGF